MLQEIKIKLILDLVERGKPLSVCLLLAFTILAMTPIPSNGGNTYTDTKDSSENSSQVDGTWNLIKYIVNGKPDIEEVKQGYTVVREKGTQIIYKNGTLFSKRKYVINSEKNPKEIDFIRDDGTKVLGIFEIAGDEMKVDILNDEGKSKTDYPADFQEDGKIIAVYERANEK